MCPADQQRNPRMLKYYTSFSNHSLRETLLDLRTYLSDLPEGNFLEKTFLM